MKKRWLLFIIIAGIIVSLFNSLPLRAGQTFTDITEDISDDGNVDEDIKIYTLIGSDKVSEVFRFPDGSIGEFFATLDTEIITGIMGTPQTFTLIREKDGREEVFFNFPNVQQLLINELYQFISDGFTGNSYNVSETERWVKVGGEKQADGSIEYANAMERFGFSIPSLRYEGEYPKVFFSPTTIIPTSWLELLGSYVKTVLFGSSFIKAPTIETYSTIKYKNHLYEDENNNLIYFLSENWQTYFIDTIKTKNYVGQEAIDWVVDNRVSREEAKTSKSSIESKKGQIKSAQEEIKKLDGELTEIDTKLADYEEQERQAENAKLEWINQNEKNKQELSKQLSREEINKACPIERDSDGVILSSTVSCRKNYISSKRKGAIKPTPKPADWVEPQEMRDLKKRKIQVNSEISDLNGKIANLEAEIKKLEEAITNYVKFINEVMIYDEEFIDYGVELDKPLEDSGKDTLFAQCFIETDEDGNNTDCKSKYTGQQLALNDILISTDAYKIKFNGNDNYENAIKLVNTLQMSIGRDYADVVSTIVEKMIINSDNTIRLEELENYRVMPYDVDAMDTNSFSEVRISDPRVKQSLIYNVRNGDYLRFLPNIWFTLSESIVNLGGTIAEITVVLNDLISFTLLDKMGISPMLLWENGLVQLILIGMVLFMIFKLFIYAKDYVKGRKGLVEVIIQFVIFLIAFGYLSWFSINPEAHWSNINKTIDTIMNLGETTLSDTGQYNGLTQGKDAKSKAQALYWSQYFDLWSSFNTGYSISDTEQLIDKTDKSRPEVKLQNGEIIQADKDINTGNLNLWSVVLADSFTDTENNETVKNSAYRVVDHFMSPRLEIKSENNGKSIKITKNENYNKRFQRDILNSISKLLGLVLILFVILIKFLTFIFLFYNLLLFTVKLLLSLGNKRIDVKNTLIDIFYPLGIIILLGIYSNMLVFFSINLSGIIGIVIIIGLMYITISLITWWHNSNYRYFPNTLYIVYSIIQKVGQGK